MMVNFLSFASLLLLGSLTSTALAQDCVPTLDAVGKDLFPDKVEPVHSMYWNISYHNTYKILTNTADQDSYLLYERGTCPPDELLNVFNASNIIEIPVTTVGITQTNSITYMEQLEALDKIKVFLTDPSFISSPCFLDLVNDDQVGLVNDYAPGEGFFDPTQDRSGPAQAVAFQNGFQTNLPFTQTVTMAEYLEPTNAAIFEWIKYYAAFFNLEEKATAVVAAAEARYQCVAANAARVESDQVKPVVLWAYYSSYCEGWDVGTCTAGNYYCEFANACAAELLGSDEGSIDQCQGFPATYMTVEEVVELGKDADYWIFPAPNWNATYEEFKDQLEPMKSVRNQEVYDYLGAGENAWFEQRYAEYYDVAQDFCSVVGTTRGLTGVHWFRNVFTEEVGEYGSCSEERTPILLTDGECEALDPVIQDDGEGDGDSAAFLNTSSISLLASVLMGIILSL